MILRHFEFSRACAASLLLALAPWAAPVSAADPEPSSGAHNAAQLSAWWDVVEMIGDGTPWDDCRHVLDKVIAQYPNSAHTPQCRRLRDSIALAVAAESTVPAIGADADLASLVAALPAARVSVGWVLMPLQYYAVTGQTIWQFYAERAIVGPASSALMICKHGRSAIPALIEQLDNATATRSISPDRSQLAAPVVLRVGDIALGLIEAITLCRFRDSPSSFHRSADPSLVVSEWPDQDRAALIAEVRAWWEATRELPPVEAVLWRIRRADRDQQLEMLDALIATGDGVAALPFLNEAYRDGEALDEKLAERMLRAGSRAPLDYLHDAVRLGRPVDHTMVELIAGHGDVQDFQLLRDIVVKAATDGPASAMNLDLPMLVNVMNYSDTRLCVPLLVAVLEIQQADLAGPVDGERVPVPAYIGRAAEKIETVSGIAFGFDARESPARRRRAIGDIIEWWRREGRGAYDYERCQPHAPPGIR